METHPVAFAGRVTARGPVCNLMLLANVFRVPFRTRTNVKGAPDSSVGSAVHAMVAFNPVMVGIVIWMADVASGAMSVRKLHETKAKEACIVRTRRKMNKHQIRTQRISRTMK
jgi:hypothetical protein